MCCFVGQVLDTLGNQRGAIILLQPTRVVPVGDGTVPLLSSIQDTRGAEDHLLQPALSSRVLSRIRQRIPVPPAEPEFTACASLRSQ